MKCHNKYFFFTPWSCHFLTKMSNHFVGDMLISWRKIKQKYLIRKQVLLPKALFYNKDSTTSVE